MDNFRVPLITLVKPVLADENVIKGHWRMEHGGHISTTIAPLLPDVFVLWLPPAVRKSPRNPAAMGRPVCSTIPKQN